MSKAAKQPKQVTIKGNTYIIGVWDIDTSLEIFAWMVKRFGSGFMSLFMSESGQNLIQGRSVAIDPEEEKDLIEELLQKISTSLEPKEYVKYCKRILTGIHFNGQELDFKFHFAGRVFDLHSLMFEVLTFQYSDFLGGGNAEDS
jgi:hypothetical protein